jgi:hypothetical protein
MEGVGCVKEILYASWTLLDKGVRGTKRVLQPGYCVSLIPPYLPAFVEANNTSIFELLIELCVCLFVCV